MPNEWNVVGPKRRRFLSQADDWIGTIEDIVGKLADAKVDVTAIDAICVDSGYGALCWIAPRGFNRAAQVLVHNRGL